MKKFFAFVEIRTKIASLLPFLFGAAYAAYVYGRLRVAETALFFFSMILFDMATTAINNTVDSKSGATLLPYRRSTAIAILSVLLLLATALGVALAIRTGPVVLLAGALCFFVGIFYTFGPAPLSRMPLGEIFSGIFMGFFIPFLVVYVNAPDGTLVSLGYSAGILTLSMDVPALFRLAIATIPAICGIAGIMLANNICDLETDQKVGRYTLPHFIGTRHALWLFAGLYAAAFASVAAMAVFRVLPAYVLLVLLAAIPTWKNLRTFFRRQSKADTFPLSVADLVLVMVPLIAVAAVAAILG